jgi:hypothetical protein
MIGGTPPVVEQHISAVSQWSEVSGLVSELEDRFNSVIVRLCCEKLVAEARGQFGNPEYGESPPLKAIASKLVKTQQAEKTLSVCCSELQSMN